MQRLRVLMLCDFFRRGANTTADHALGLSQYSRHDVSYCDPVLGEMPPWVDLSCFDVLVIHYSIYVLGDAHLSPSWRQAISDSSNIKVQFIQDEYRTVYAIHERMQELGVNILFTCFPESEIEKVYPEHKLPGVVKVPTLTGYVPEYLCDSHPDFDAVRPIDVGYRSRGEGFWWLGELYRDKARIAREFAARAAGKGLELDISTKEVDRIYGPAWPEFLRSCRCTLGSESGASVVDFTGEIEAQVKAYIKSSRNPTFEEAQDLYFKGVEWKIRQAQVSPRIFEAISCGACLVLFEGEYSGVVNPGVHYIPLERDFSNCDEVIEMIKDDELVKSTAQRAFEHVIASGEWSYRKLASEFDEAIDRYLEDGQGACMRKRDGAQSGEQRRDGRKEPLLAEGPKTYALFSSLSSRPVFAAVLDRVIMLLGVVCSLTGAALRRSAKILRVVFNGRIGTRWVDRIASGFQLLTAWSWRTRHLLLLDKRILLEMRKCASNMLQDANRHASKVLGR